MPRLALLLSLSLVSIGCGSSSGGAGAPDATPSLDGLTSVDIAPADATLVMDGDAPVSQQLTATGHFADGSTRDVTGQVTWSLTNTGLGLIPHGAFTSFNHGGFATVRAGAGQTQGLTTLTVIVKRTISVTEGVGGESPAHPAPTVPDNAGDLFKAPPTTDAAKKPAVVYPNSGVVLPPNLGKLEVHYRPGSGNTVFALSFKNAFTDIQLFLRCGDPVDGGCVYQPPPAVWTWLAETNRGQGPLTVGLRATDDKGTAVATADSTTVEFTRDDLRGAVYYWSTSREAILRWDFASTTQKEAELFYGDGKETDKCVGCHALSRDGRHITIQEAGQDSGRQFLVDVASRNLVVPFPAAEPAVFTSWNPEGTQYVGVYDDGSEDNGVDKDGRLGDGPDDQLLVIDGVTGQRTSVIQAGGTDKNPINHPDWSASGDKIAFVSIGDDTRSLQRFHTGRVGFVQRTGTTWGAPVWLTPQTAGKNRYYPAFSPDSSFLVYDESTCPAGLNTDKLCNGDTDPTATLTFVPAVAGGKSVVGARASAPGIEDRGARNLTNSFPKWCPFEFERSASEQHSRLMWVTFSSTRRYGLRNPPTPSNTSENDKGTLLWMAAVDPDAVARGEDPTSVPFVLPFQDLDSSNHIAQWAEEAVPDVD